MVYKTGTFLQMLALSAMVRWSAGNSNVKNTINPYISEGESSHFTNYIRYTPQYERKYGTKPGNRIFSLPEGTKITLTPEIKIPILKDDHGIGCDFEAKVPVTIKLDEVTWSSLGHEMFDLEWIPFHKKSFFNSDPAPEPEFLEAHSRKLRDLSGFYRHATNISFSQGRNDVASLHRSSNDQVQCERRLSLRDRRAIIQKLEMLTTSFGIHNPRACLLRAACEIHEMPTPAALGLLGEIATTIFSVQQFVKDCKEAESEAWSTLSPFVDAEIDGKSLQCQSYKKHCPKSIFINL